MIECAPAAVPRDGGAYVLEFVLEHEVTVNAGRLGHIAVGPGRVRYYGSARGPGGLRARVLRHLRPDDRRDRWHIDGLTREVPVDRLWIDLKVGECELVQRDLATGKWKAAVSGFGSSDCRNCGAHLLVHIP
jgi:Uri superfamily endonuclease